MTEEESQQSIECKAAIRAALEKVGEYCGLGGMSGAGHTIKFAGAIIEYPEEIHQVATDAERTDEGSIMVIGALDWTFNQATSLCRSVFEGEKLEEEACVDRVTKMLAKQIVKQART
jgi:hypothetical protein